MQEIWKDIPDYNGNYQISNFGRVKSLKKWNGTSCRILSPGKTHKGYLAVSLSKNGKAKSIFIHRLVAKAFITNPDNLPQINHKNENKEDNHVQNLEWCDNSYNMNYGTRSQRQIDKVSKPVICVETQIIYKSAAEASRLNPPIRQGNITLCCQGKNKTAGGFHWRYHTYCGIKLLLSQES